MTAEHGFIPGEKVTGFLRLNTSRGPVMIEITDAVVIVTRTSDSPVPESQELPKSAALKLQEFLETLPEGKQGKHWATYRASHIQTYGNNSLWGMMPETLDRDTHFLTGFFNALKRTGINRKKDLLKASVGKLEGSRLIGDKGIEFAIILKEIIKAELEVAQNQSS